jgi:hypothetical protein
MATLQTSLLATLPDDLLRTICASLPCFAEVHAVCDQAARAELGEEITAARVRADNAIRDKCADLPRLVDVQAACDQAGRPDMTEVITAERVRSGRWAILHRDEGDFPNLTNPKDIVAPQGMVAAIGADTYELLEDQCAHCKYRTFHQFPYCMVCSGKRKGVEPHTIEREEDMFGWDDADYEELMCHLLQERGPIDWSLTVA